MRPFAVALLALAACAAHEHSAEHHHGMHHAFDDPEKWAAEFEDPSRDAWQKPDEVISALKLSPDACVADIGSGTGYFSVRLSKALPRGKVYGIDIEPKMVDYLNARSKREGLSNLVSLVGASDDPKIPEPCDAALIVDTYHHLDNREEYFRRVAGELKPHGLVAVVDFKKGSKRGPPDEFKFAPEEVTRELTAAGYAPEASLDLPDQYLLTFRR